MRHHDLVFLGLSVTSSWGNGHATTYRALLRALAACGHDILFLERDVPWYAAHRDMPHPSFARVGLYRSVDELERRWRTAIEEADVVVVGSYVPDGVAVGRFVQRAAEGVTAFYDIDTPVTLEALERGRCTYLDPALVSGYGLYLSFTGGPVLERIERELGSPCARPLYCSVDPDVHHRATTPPAWDLGYLGTYSADRQPALEALLVDAARAWPAGRFVVAGAQYPDAIDWPGNVLRTEHVDPARHATFYGAQRFTLNVTRAAMRSAGWSPSVRLFEAAAAGVPVISDAWPGLESFFAPGREIVVAEDTADVLRTLREMPEEERTALAARARARTLASHSAARRAQEFESFVREAARAGLAARRPS